MALNLSTEALARASARRPWLVVAAWVAVFAVSVALIFNLLSDALTNEFGFTGNPDSKQADTLLEERLRGPEKVNEIVIVRSADRTVDAPAFKAFVEGLQADVAALGPDVIEQGASYYQTGDESLVSADRRTTILPFVMAGDEDEADENIDDVLAVVRGVDGVEGFRVLITGGASVNKDIQEVSESDLQTGEAFEFSFFATNVITMMGLAVGIDYSLFVVSRYREERSRGREKLEAIATAGATASRAVFFSGMTVVLALLGILIVPTTIFRSLAAGAIIVVIVSVLVSLTLLPALLGILGDKVDALRLPFTGRRVVHEGGSSPNGFWDRVTRTVMRHPVISLVATAALLIALAVPYIDIQTGSAGVATLPDGRQSKEGFLVLEEDFSFGLVTPAEIAIDGDVNGPQVQQSIGRLEAGLAEDPSFGRATVQVNDSGDLALFSVPVSGDPSSGEAGAAIERLRGEYIPRAFPSVDAGVYVTGIAARQLDYLHVTDSYTPIVLAFVLGLSFVLLTVVFRSLVVPLKAIVMNLLSVGAAYGLLVLVFQKGVGNELFGFQKVDIIEAWVPLWTFSILFGLSMAYHVFLLSRIRERFIQTNDNSESVAFGLRSTAGIITGAALIMAGVFGGIAAGQLVMFQQMGFGLAVAVLLDATIVRSILVPAAMQLLGARNWYLPSVLRWLPEMRIERKEGASASSEAS